MLGDLIVCFIQSYETEDNWLFLIYQYSNVTWFILIFQKLYKGYRNIIRKLENIKEVYKYYHW